MTGMDKNTGKHISGLDHLQRSIQDILSTHVETLVLLRPYGGGPARLVDAPLNPATLVDLYAATAEAIDRWEPRLTLTRVQAEVVQSDGCTLNMEGYFKHNGEAIVLEGLTI